MSYYILPKKNKINVKYSITNKPIKQTISFTLQIYLDNLQSQLNLLLDKNNNNDFFDVFKLSNPYEFIFSKVFGSNYSVSKLKPHSNSFYCLLEIMNIFNITEYFYDNNIKTLLFSPNNDSILYCLDILREDKNDIHISLKIDNHYLDEYITYLNSIDFLYFELEEEDYYSSNEYVFGLIYVLCYIILYQKKNGISIIKIGAIYNKPILDIIYILTSMYYKVYIIKPNSSNIGNDERYIICKNFIFNNAIFDYLHKLKFLLNNKNNIIINKENIENLVEGPLPYYFINKIEESNIIIGQQKIEFINHVIDIIKNKVKDDKLENIKKNNIHKCIQWCEKYKIPYNKFVDKINIFLPLQKMEDQDGFDYHDFNENELVSDNIV